MSATVAAFIYSTRRRRTGASRGDCDQATVPVYEATTGLPAGYLGVAWHGTPSGLAWSRVAPGEVDAWLESRGLRRTTGGING